MDRSERVEAAFTHERLGSGFAEPANVVEAEADGDVGKAVGGEGFGRGC